jgi:hypothetical protein
MHQDEFQRHEHVEVLRDPVRFPEEWERQRREIEDLRAALASRPVIDQAKGILMAMYAIDAEQAFQVLSRWSQTRNIKVRDLAATLVENVVCAHPRAPFDVASGRPAARPRASQPRVNRHVEPRDR